eukprot:100080-Pelagomonas_calceolata.AAC.1
MPQASWLTPPSTTGPSSIPGPEEPPRRARMRPTLQQIKAGLMPGSHHTAAWGQEPGEQGRGQTQGAWKWTGTTAEQGGVACYRLRGWCTSRRLQ